MGQRKVRTEQGDQAEEVRHPRTSGAEPSCWSREAGEDIKAFGLPKWCPQVKASETKFLSNLDGSHSLQWQDIDTRISAPQHGPQEPEPLSPKPDVEPKIITLTPPHLLV